MNYWLKEVRCGLKGKIMIEYIEGNIFKSTAEVIVNPVNTVGIMGKGLALKFKINYPDMFVKYQEICNKKLLKPGILYLHTSKNKKILLFPTKEHWKNNSKVEYIEKGLIAFINGYEKYNIKSIAFPKLGCGLGGLDWQEIKVLMEKYLEKLPIEVYIYV